MTRTNSKCFRACRLAAALMAVWHASAQETPPLLPDGAVTLTAVAERSTLNRLTNQLTSTVDLRAVNVSGQQIAGPLHMPVKFFDPAGQEVRAGITVEGGSGGFGAAPWQVPYFDLSGKVAAGGWQPDQQLTWTLSFTRHRALAVSYLFTPAGFLNRAPVADAGGPYRIAAGESAALTGTATDADGDTLNFVWRFEDGSEATGAATARAFSTPGLHEVTLTVTDGRGGEAVDTGVVAVTPAGEFALAWTRALDGTGHPLAGAEVRETGPGGERTFAASGETAFVSLGGLPGAQEWRFTAPGYYPVWRRAVLPAGKVTLIPNPWLAAESEAEGGISILEATTLLDRTRTLKLSFPAGAFQQAGRTLLTSRPEQTLPAELPAGWSPLASFSFYPPVPGAQEDGTAEVKLSSALPAGRGAAVTRYDPQGGQWIVLTLLAGAGGETVSFPIRQGGDYALVLADAAPAATPAVPNAGEALAGVAVPALPAGSITAAGRVEPAVRAASEEPDAVTARASVDFAAAGLTLPSGLWFRMDMEETYDLRDGGRFRTPAYDATFFAWRGLTPPAPPAQLQGPFPMRPRLLIVPSLLGEAHLHAVIHAPQDEELLVINETGGQLSAGDATLTVPAGATGGLATAQLRMLPPGGLSALAAGLPVAGAFLLDFANFLPGSVLGFTWRGKLDPLSDYVLARVVNAPGANGLQPVLRLRSDAAGFISGAEPAVPPHLSGIDRGGQYLIVKLGAPQGLVAGTARFQSDNSPAPASLVRVSGQPWLAFTGTDGRFDLLAPAGTLQLTAERTVEGFTGRAAAEMTADLDPVSADVRIGSAPPFVISTSPANGALKVSPVTPVTVTFSEPMAPAAFGPPGAVKLLAPDGSDVPAGITLDLSGRTVTLLPVNPLAAATDYKLVLSPDLRDRQSLPLEGPREFTFTTAAPAARGEGAVLTIYEPGGAGPTPADQALINAIPGYTPGTDKTKVVAIGSAGSADPEVPVILVNESTGTTATVLSKPDGSFANFIEATAEDFISAVFVNANGTRVTIAATRQKFDDGRTGLFSGGGILEAENEGARVEVIVEPGAVPSRTVFALEPVPISEVLTLMGGVQPEEGGKILGGLRYEESADPLQVAADVSFSLKAGDIPPGVNPDQATFALTIPMEIDGVKAFHVIDSMEFEDDGGAGRLVTRSPPFMGLLLRQFNELRQQAGLNDTINRTLTAGFATAVGHNVISAFLIPVLVAPFVPQKIGGKVVVLEDGEALTETGGRPLSGAFVRFETGIGAIDSTTPGLFRRGETFAMTGADGRFVVVMPTSFNRRIVSTHPRFPFQRAVSTGIAAGEVVARTTLVFRKGPPVVPDIEDTAAPDVSLAQSPVRVASGTGENDGAVLTVSVADDLSVANISIERHEFRGTADGIPKDIDLLRPPTLISEESGAPGRKQARYRLQAVEKGSAIYKIRATDAEANLTTVTHVVVFGDPAAGGGVAANRRLSSAWPPDGATGQMPGTPIRLRFSIPLLPEDLSDLTWITLGPPDEIAMGGVEASSDRRELILHYLVKVPDPSTLTIAFGTDRVNQVPGNANGPVPATYLIEFGNSAPLEVDGDSLVSGAGVVSMGRFIYTIDRTESVAGEIRSFCLTPDGKMEELQRIEVPERVLDLVAIPAYPLREFDGTVRPPEPYLAVVSGGANDIKRMGFFRVAPDGKLSRLFSSRPPIALGISQVVKVKWDPPYIAFQEIASGSTSVSLINLNAFYIGFRLSETDPDQLELLPREGRSGTDLNNDGDFADAGEVAPLPAKRDGQVFGLEFSWAPGNPNERLKDFDFNADFGLLGGVFSGPAGSGLLMALGGGSVLDEKTARLTFTREPKRLLFMPRLLLRRNGQEQPTDVALVSTVANADGNPTPLFVVDVTNAAQPALLGSALLPPAAGTLNSIILRDDGLLALSTAGSGVMLLDPRLLLETSPDGITAALVKQIPGLAGGGQRTFTADASGVTLTANGTNLLGRLDAPQISVVTFEHPPFDTEQWKGGAVGAGATVEEKMESVLAGARRQLSGLVFPSGDNAVSTDPRNHYYVLIRAPGVAGAELELAAASVDAAGRPILPNKRLAAPTFLGHQAITGRFLALAAFSAFKRFDFEDPLASVLSLSAEEAYRRLVTDKFSKPSYAADLVAHRLSNIETHPLFNVYLAGPLVLLAEDVSRSRFDDLKDGMDRRFLAAAAGFWVGLSPRLDESLLIHPFKSRQDESIDLSINAGINLGTLVNLTEVVFHFLAGNKLKAIQQALQFIDAELERTIQPGVNTYVHVGRQRNPVLFVPGVMGSLMREGAEGDGENLWIDLTDVIPLNRSVGKLQLGANGQPDGEGVAADASHVLQYVAGFADMGGSMLEFLAGDLDYRLYEFEFMQKALTPTEDVAKKHPELFPFAYDWRRNNAESAQKLARYVDFIRTLHPEAENVDIVAHSMGGLVSRRFMLDHPGVVGKFVVIASPLLGATKAVFSKREGDLDDFKINLLIGSTTGKKICRYMPGLDQLMPSEASFRLGFRPLWEHGVDLDGDGFPFGALEYADYRSFVDGLLVPKEPLPRPVAMGQNNQLFHSFGPAGASQDDWSADTSGTQLYHLVGVQTLPKTVLQVKVRPRLVEVPAAEAKDVAIGLPPVDFTDTDEIIGGQPRLPEDGDAAFPVSTEAFRMDFDLELVRGAGDGTVPLLCAARGYSAGGTFDLNPPRMRVIPIVAKDRSSGANESVAHVPVLVNKLTKRWVGRILNETFRDVEVPVIAIAGDATVAEGENTTLRVSVTHVPEGVSGKPVFTWDLGDGRMRTGPFATVGYADNGDYVVTCVARFPGEEELTGTGGVAALTSFVVHVANLPPAPQLTFDPAAPVRGQPVRLKVKTGDPSPEDTFLFTWNTGDQPAGTAPRETRTPFLSHTYALAGDYDVSVTITDDEGAAATATQRISVAEQAGLPAAPLGRQPRDGPDDPNPFDDDPTGGLEYARIFCRGIDTSEERLTVDHDGRRAVGNLDGSIVRHDAGEADTIAAGEVQVDVYRELGGGESSPAMSLLKVRANGTAVTFFIEYYRGNGQVRCFFHDCRTTADQEVTLQLSWDNLIAMQEASVADMTAPRAIRAGLAAGCRRPELVADNIFDEKTSDVSLDMVMIDQAPVADAATDPTPTYIDDGPPPPVPGDSPADPCKDLEQRLFRRLTSRTAHSATAPNASEVAAGTTPSGQTGAATGSAPVQQQAQLTEAEAEDVRNAVKTTFNTTAATGGGANPAAELFNRFVIDLADVLILEQGTGACLWKGPASVCNGAYVKGKSDNDYELFFPSLKSRDVALDPSNPAHVAGFRDLAHSSRVMEGDWYFKPPRGYEELPAGSSRFFDRGEVPDARDAAAFEAFLNRVTHWGYTPPRESGGPGNPERVLLPRFSRTVESWSDTNGVFTGTPEGILMLRKGAILFGEAPNKTPFNFPLTPAQIASYALTRTVTTIPVAREVLTDVSFFPFRREHFLFAVMSLEKPPPFGDDPIGDAGMGRSLLLLKWVLEGAFLPAFGGFNAGIDDMVLRGQVHERLQQRQAEIVREGFEWGLFQEFALLSESGDLRVRPANPVAAADRERCRSIFGDFTTAHDDKIMKKAGKAAIRGALARLATDEGARTAFMAMTPQAYSANTSLISFEHFIEFQVRSHLNLFNGYGPGGSNLEEEDFRMMLGAKVGDKATFEAIRRSPEGVDGFLLKCFALLNKLQSDTANGYVASLNGLLQQGRINERRARIENAAAVQLGFTPPGGEHRSGRLAMHGFPGEPAHDAHWSFAITMRNNSGQSVGPLSVVIESEGVANTACSNITLNASDTSLVVPNKERGICTTGNEIKFLTYHRAVNSSPREVRPLTVRIEGIPAAVNNNSSNDAMLLESVFLEPDAFEGPRFRNGRIDLKIRAESVPGNIAIIGDCFLEMTLSEFNPNGTDISPVTGATFAYIDAGGLTHTINQDQLLISNGTARANIDWPIVITAQSPSGVHEALAVNADVTNVFLTATEPTDAQRNFLNVVRDSEATFNRAAALAPSSHGFYSQLDAVTNQSSLDALILSVPEILFVSRNDEQMADGRAVIDIVSAPGETLPKRGLYMVGLIPGQPQAPTQPFSDGDFNPGRGGKTPPGSLRDFDGRVFLLRDLFDRCASPVETLNFVSPTGTRGFDCLTLVKSEIFHEFNVRLLDLLGNASANVSYDRALRRFYPNLNQAHSFLFN
jgi:pimeloyl-ACP methyl ester carboxylesterase/PKD repeat protein